MVYKTEVRGIRTGNTVRKKFLKFAYKYRRSSYIVRSHVGEDVLDDPDFLSTGVFGEDRCMPDNIVFSLNKQRRWEMPAMLEDTALCKRPDDPCPYGIQVVRKCNITRKSNCTSITTSNGIMQGGRNIKTKSRGFFQSASVFPRYRPRYHIGQVAKSRRRSCYNRRLHETRQEVSEPAQIRYEVISPADKESYLSTEIKMLAHNLPDTDMAPAGNPRISKNGRRRHGVRSHSQSDFDDADIASDVFADDRFMEDDEPSIPMRSTTTLHDVLRMADTQHKLKYESDYDREIADAMSASFADTGAGMWTTELNAQNSHTFSTVILNNDELSTKHLQRQFGKDYFECRCFPRKFVLNITSQLQESVLWTYNAGRMLKGGACLVFVHDADNDVNTPEQPVYTVELKHQFQTDETVEAQVSQSIPTLTEYMDTSLSEIVQYSLFLLETMPITTSVPVQDGANMDDYNPTVLEEYFNWSTATYLPNNALVFTSSVSGDTASEIQPTESQDDSEFDDFEFIDVDEASPLQPDSLCSICCEPMGTSSNRTSLKPCGHWFCNTCWNEYVSSMVNTGVCEVRCPEHECKIKMDAGTMLSLVDFEAFGRYARLVHDKNVAAQKDMLFCPNANCGRVLRVNTDGTEVAHCACGELVCMLCSGRSHWPADCDSAMQYHHTLQETGDSDFVKNVVFTQYYIFGKKCPSCNVFIAKDGGCNYVTCICEVTFCWACHKISEECQGTYPCTDVGYNEQYRTDTITLTTFDLDDRPRQKWYKMALRRRMNILPTKMCAAETALRSHIKPMQNFLQSGLATENLELEEFVGRRSGTRRANSARDFLQNILNLHIEINNVVEYSAAMLNSRDFQDDVEREFEREVRHLAKCTDLAFNLFVDDANCGEPPLILIRKFKNVHDELTNKLYHFIDIVKALKIA